MAKQLKREHEAPDAATLRQVVTEPAACCRRPLCGRTGAR